MWFWGCAILTWGGLAVWVGYSLGIRGAAKLAEDALEEERTERLEAVQARGGMRLSRVRFTRR
jgi:hypothetical protein